VLLLKACDVAPFLRLDVLELIAAAALRLAGAKPRPEMSRSGGERLVALQDGPNT